MLDINCGICRTICRAGRSLSCIRRNIFRRSPPRERHIRRVPRGTSIYERPGGDMRDQRSIWRAISLSSSSTALFRAIVSPGSLCMPMVVTTAA